MLTITGLLWLPGLLSWQQETYGKILLILQSTLKKKKKLEQFRLPWPFSLRLFC